MKVIIMGCGRVGEQLCRLMDSDGHDVTVIDPDAKNLAHLGAEFKGHKLHGVGFDRDVLLEAGVDQADAFVATGQSDNVNIVAARIARNFFHVPRVIARLYDPRRAEIYRRLGLVTISMTVWGANRINELLAHSNLDSTMSFGRGEVSLVAIEIPAHLVGRQVALVTVPGEINVVSITREGEAILPTLGSEFSAGDLVHFAVHTSGMDHLESLLGI